MSGAENMDRAVKGLVTKVALHQCRQPAMPLAKIGGTDCQEYLHPRARMVHNAVTISAMRPAGVMHPPRSGFMHIDLGPARSWGEPFPARPTPFVPEVPPAREVLAESRTLKGGGAAGVTTIGAAGVEVAQDVLAETQSAILPLVPYLDTLRWVFIAVALIGIAVAIHARIDDWKRDQR